MQKAVSIRFVSLLLWVAGVGCEGAGGPAEQPTETSTAQVSTSTPEQGAVQVAIVINHSPKVSKMTSSSGRVEEGVVITLGAQASDPDQDAIHYTWAGSCPGTFACAHRNDESEVGGRNDCEQQDQVVFTADALGSATSCSFEVIASDGRGGYGKGTLVLTTIAPTIESGSPGNPQPALPDTP